MPDYRKPRQQVQDLQGNAQLQPSAQPLDTYARPGAPEIQAPLQTNPMLKLADSLSALEPTLQEFTKQQTQRYTQAELAKGESDFWANRDKANAMIKAGEIPLGASPYAVRGFQRAALKQLGDEYSSRVFADFHGEAGAQARESNNPADMRKFLDTSFQGFSKEWLSGGYFTDLDRQEVLHPALEQANRTMMNAHAEHRVKEVERQYEDLVSVQSESILEKELGSLNYATSPEDRDAAYARAGRQMTDLLDNGDRGFIRNGGSPQRGNDLLVEAIITKAAKTGNRSYLEALEHLRPAGGPRLSDIGRFQGKILQAEEHITSRQIQEERHQWAVADRPFDVASRERQVEQWKEQDQRHEREKADWVEHKSEKEIFKDLSRRTYEGLRTTDSKRGVEIINQALLDAEDQIPEQAERLRGIVGEFTKHRLEVPEDDSAVLRMKAKILSNPLSVSYGDVMGMFGKTANRHTTDDLISLLNREQVNGGHPFMRQPEMTEMLHAIQKGAMQSPADEFSAEGQTRAADALGDFRGKAAAWLADNPKGNAAKFTDYMRGQIKPILERHNPEYGIDRQKERDKAEAVKAKQEAEAQAAKVTQKREASKDVYDFARQVDEAQRQKELARLKATDSQPRMNPGEFDRWMRGERVDTYQGPKMQDKTTQFLDWLAGFKTPSEPTPTPSPTTERGSAETPRITAKDFGRLSTKDERQQVLSAGSDQERRAILAKQLAPKFMASGQSVEDMSKEIDTFLLLLAKLNTKP